MCAYVCMCVCVCVCVRDPPAPWGTRRCAAVLEGDILVCIRLARTLQQQGHQVNKCLALNLVLPDRRNGTVLDQWRTVFHFIQHATFSYLEQYTLQWPAMHSVTVLMYRLLQTHTHRLATGRLVKSSLRYCSLRRKGHNLIWAWWGEGETVMLCFSPSALKYMLHSLS